jgi:DNA-directed RNA polymerase specialized sigma24 family protein
MSTEGKGSVSIWIDTMRNPAEDKKLPAEQLWSRYFDQLVRQARITLSQIAPRARDTATDEEDVAVSALRSFCDGVADGRFSWMEDREQLGGLLATILKRKVCAVLRAKFTLKRGGGKPRGDIPIELLIQQGPTPDEIATVDDELRRLLSLLRDDQTKCQIVRLKLEGYRSAEIADMFGVSERTVERKMELIRKTWCKEVERDE